MMKTSSAKGACGLALTGLMMTSVAAWTGCSTGPATPTDGSVGADTTPARDSAAPHDAPLDAPAADLTGDVGAPPSDMTGLVVLPYDGGTVEVTGDSFQCLTGWDQVRLLRIASLTGRLQQALDVANDPMGKAYPVGTIIQLIPNEAMVKREPGFSPGSGDWEFFKLMANTDGTTTIQSRGTTDTMCFNCHAAAAATWDYICEKDHGCDPLPFTDQIYMNLQMNDPRCGH
jgi:hypothetical protein